MNPQEIGSNLRPPPPGLKIEENVLWGIFNVHCGIKPHLLLFPSQSFNTLYPEPLAFQELKFKGNPYKSP